MDFAFKINCKVTTKHSLPQKIVHRHNVPSVASKVFAIYYQFLAIIPRSYVLSHLFVRAVLIQSKNIHMCITDSTMMHKAGWVLDLSTLHNF